MNASTNEAQTVLETLRGDYRAIVIPSERGLRPAREINAEGRRH